MALAACGGDEKAPAAPGSAERPLVAQTPEATPGAVRTNEGAAPVKGPGGGEPPAGEQLPGYQALVERQAAKPQERFTPCNLVTRAEARAIIGEPVRTPLEAPQGPTCIYRSQHGDAFVTLAVQAAEFKHLRRQIQDPEPQSIGGVTAYCGELGQPMLYLPLSKGRVLSVSAPCEVARQFATRAVQQLPS